MTNRLKLFVMMGRDRGSFEDNRVGAWGSSLFLGLSAVGPDAEPCAGRVIGDKDVDKRSWGIIDMAEEAAVAGDETVDAAEESSEDRNFVAVVGDEGGVGLGSETVILGAGLSSYGFSVSAPFSGELLRRRVAPIGT